MAVSNPTVLGAQHGGQQWSTGPTYQSKCFHGGHKALWTMPNGHGIYAAQESQLDAVTRHSLVIDCTGFVNKQSEAHRANVIAEAQRQALVFEGAGAEALRALSDHVQKPTPRVHIAWPDGGVPPLVPSFWRALLDSVQGSVVVCCIGAHGRTGTALAALYLAQHASFDGEPIELGEVVATVRKLHCEQAVETHDQVDYLEKVADFYGATHGERIEPSYHYRAPAKPAPLGANVGDTSAATRAVVNGYDSATGIKTSVQSYVGNGPHLTPLSDDIDSPPQSKRARKRASKGKAKVQYRGE